MKILMVNPAMRPVCGRTTMVLHLSRALHKSGHEVVLVTSRDSDRSVVEGLPFETRFVPMDPDRKSPGAVLALRTGLSKLVKEFMPDIVHTHHRFPAYVLKFVPLGKAKHVTTVHSFLEGKRAFQIQPDAWVAVSNAVAEWMHMHFNIPGGSMDVIRNGVPQTAQHNDFEASFHEQGLSALAAGRFAPEKGFDVLIDAWKQFAASTGTPASLTIAGTGPEEARLKEKASTASGSISIIDGSGRMDELYAQANIVIVPSRTEPLSYIVLEAGIRGIPLIVTDSGGPSELVADKQSGLVVPSDDAHSLEKALHFATQNYENLLAFAAQMRTQLVEQHSVNAMAVAYIRLYTRILTQGT